MALLFANVSVQPEGGRGNRSWICVRTCHTQTEARLYHLRVCSPKLRHQGGPNRTGIPVSFYMVGHLSAPWLLTPSCD